MDQRSTEPENLEPVGGAGRRGRPGRRATALVAVAAAVAVAVGGVAGVSLLGADEAPGATADRAATASGTSTPVADGSLEVSGSGVGTQPFGTDADDVLAAAVDRFGEPDRSTGPQRYARIAGSAAWFEDADDPLSPSWRYPVTDVTCWGAFCLVFGGDRADALGLRGWERAPYGDGSEATDPAAGPEPDVRLAGTGIRLGDSWQRLRAAYPGVVAGGAEGASLAVHHLPWAAISDG